MFITSLSISFAFLGVSIIAFIAFFYFKILIIKSSDSSKSRDKIIGNMKDPVSWRHKNNRMSYICLFWAIISLGVFIYFKFFTNAGLVPTIYLFVYIATVVLSTILFKGKNTASI